MQTEPAHIPHNMLRKVKVQIPRWHQTNAPVPHMSAVHESAWRFRMEEANQEWQAASSFFCFSSVHISNVTTQFLCPQPQVDS